MAEHDARKQMSIHETILKFTFGASRFKPIHQKMK